MKTIRMVIHDTFEAGQEMPVVRHIFYAPTRAKALAYYEAHLKSDAFMRECTVKGNFRGKFKCSVKMARARLKMIPVVK